MWFKLFHNENVYQCICIFIFLIACLIMTCLPGHVISQNQEEIYNCEEHILGTLYHKGLI